MEKDIRISLTTEHFEDLIKGKQIVLGSKNGDRPKVFIILQEIGFNEMYSAMDRAVEEYAKDQPSLPTKALDE